MSDEQQFDEGFESGSEAIEEQQKGGFLPEILIKILKWAALALLAVIFIVTVVLITMRIMNVGSQSQTYVVQSGAYKPKIPDESYFPLEGLRGQTVDGNYMYMIDLSFTYDKNDKKIVNVLTDRKPRMVDMLMTFFGKKTAKDMGPDQWDKLKVEIKGLVNDLLVENQIQDVLYTKFQIVPF